MLKDNTEQFDINQYICSVSGETNLSSKDDLSFDDKLKLEKQKNENTRIHTILEIWKEQQNAERTLREKYANWFIWILISQLAVISVVFILVGCSMLKYEQWTINIFVFSVFGEIVGIVSIIVRYLFTSTSKEMIELIKDQK